MSEENNDNNNQQQPIIKDNESDKEEISKPLLPQDVIEEPAAATRISTILFAMNNCQVH
jgi:hypothetical protein